MEDDLDLEVTESEATEIVNQSSLAILMGRLSDLADQPVSSNKELIGQTLTAVDETFFLVPRIEIKDDEPVEREFPDHAIEDSLNDLWNDVNS